MYFDGGTTTNAANVCIRFATPLCVASLLNAYAIGYDFVVDTKWRITDNNAEKQKRKAYVN